MALAVLPRTTQLHLRRIYRVARHIDELGDTAPGDRTAALRAFAADLHRLWSGELPRSECLQALAPTVSGCQLREEPFQDLVAANLMDQHVHSYESFEALLGYCALSAHPIGRIVLSVFGQSTPANVERSDHVCAALQVLEHCQDVAEDHRAGRVYLPQNDLRAVGLTSSTMLETCSEAALSGVVLLQVTRARRLLSDGRPLLRDLHGWARVAVAGYVAGGFATADALARSGGHVVRSEVRPRRSAIAWHAGRLLGPGGRA